MPNKYTFRKLPGEPIIVFTPSASYHMAIDVQASIETAFEVLAELTESVYYIHDWLAIKPLDINDVSVGAMSAALSQNPLFKHPQIREIIFVTTDKILLAAAEGLNSKVYDYIQVRSFSTMEEALSHVRSQG